VEEFLVQQLVVEGLFGPFGRQVGRPALEDQARRADVAAAPRRRRRRTAAAVQTAAAAAAAGPAAARPRQPVRGRRPHEKAAPNHRSMYHCIIFVEKKHSFVGCITSINIETFFG